MCLASYFTVHYFFVTFKKRPALTDWKEMQVNMDLKSCGSNTTFFMLNPALNIIGGRITLKKTSGSNVACNTFAHFTEHKHAT